MKRITTTVVVLLALSILSAGAAYAQNYTVNIDAAQQVPPNASPATGTGTLVLDGAKNLSFNISFSGLLAPETAAHIHGPAPVGANAGVQFGLPLGSPKVGVVGPLSPAQESDLNNGLLYVNIHSTQFPGGEIRGQIILQVVPIQETTWGRIKQLFD